MVSRVDHYRFLLLPRPAVGCLNGAPGGGSLAAHTLHPPGEHEPCPGGQEDRAAIGLLRDRLSQGDLVPSPAHRMLKVWKIRLPRRHCIHKLPHPRQRTELKRADGSLLEELLLPPAPTGICSQRYTQSDLLPDPQDIPAPPTRRSRFVHFASAVTAGSMYLLSRLQNAPPSDVSGRPFSAPGLRPSRSTMIRSEKALGLVNT